ncbi:MAG: nucleotidyltransferase domain-containing protein, partial [Acidimicrobiia bacterium]|nr:nucleotidyltransferase domain-containing protein [Acidimicrobiia bacterium]
MPATEKAYLGDPTGRLQELLGPDLLGVYLFGSAAYGGYRPGRSDLDVQGVVRRAL